MIRLCTAVAFLAAASAASAATRLPAPRVAPAPGWHVITTGDNPPAPSAAVLTAATIPLARDPDGPATGPPLWAIAHLPASGIVVQATDYGPPPPRFGERRLPLTIRGAPIEHGFEGVSDRHAFVRVGAAVHGLTVEVDAWFGRAHPTKAQLARADAEVRRLRFPAR